MSKTKQTGKARGLLSVLLALVLLFGFLMPAASAANAACISAGTTEYSIVAGGLLKVDLSEILSDSSHELDYSVSNDQFNRSAGISEGYYYFTSPEIRDFSPVITAACEAGSRSVTLTIHNTEPDPGLESQYNYDQTTEGSVTVYSTFSSDGIPLVGNDENHTALYHLKVEVPYFDLENYGLQDFYRYESDESGSYTGDTVIHRPTMMHWFIYMLEKYCLGVPEKDIGTGKYNPLEESVEDDIVNILGEEAYVSNGIALEYSGSAQSTYMVKLWGHDENLMYYRNHVYPLQSAGWGSTSDYILLSDGDTLDCAMFSDWGFYTHGAFLTFGMFDPDLGENGEWTVDSENGNAGSFIVNAGEAVEFRTYKFGTQETVQGGIDDFIAISQTDYSVSKIWITKDGPCTSDMEAWTGETCDMDDDGTYIVDFTGIESGDPVVVDTDCEAGEFTLKFTEPGVYYVLGIEDKSGADLGEADSAPANMRIVVQNNGACSHPDKVARAAIEADCENTGKLSYVYCPDCNTYFSDASCTVRVAYSAMTTPVDPDNHTLVFRKGNFTCENGGTLDCYGCDVCGRYFADEEATTVLNYNTQIKNQPAGHRDTDDDGTCDICGESLKTAMPGDLNGDNKITTADILALQKNFNAYNKGTLDADALKISDLNGDGKITTADILAVQKAFLANKNS